MLSWVPVNRDSARTVVPARPEGVPDLTGQGPALVEVQPEEAIPTTGALRCLPAIEPEK
jgi:hypothetical protein